MPSPVTGRHRRGRYNEYVSLGSKSSNVRFGFISGHFSPNSRNGSFRAAVSTGRRNTCVTPVCWSLDAPVRGQLVISRRSRVRHTLAHLSSAPLLASSGRLAPLSLSLRDFDVSFNFISIHTIFCVFVPVLHRPIETATQSGRSQNNLEQRSGKSFFPISAVWG